MPADVDVLRKFHCVLTYIPHCETVHATIADLENQKDQLQADGSGLENLRYNLTYTSLRQTLQETIADLENQKDHLQAAVKALKNDMIEQHNGYEDEKAAVKNRSEERVRYFLQMRMISSRGVQERCNLNAASQEGHAAKKDMQQAQKDII